MNNDKLNGFKVIHTFTRADTIADGVFDVTSVAKKAGFVIPVAITTSIWHLIHPVKQPASVESADEIEISRVTELLQFLFIAIRHDKKQQEELLFPYIASMDVPIQLFTFKAVIGPGDTAEPVITIMLPDED